MDDAERKSIMSTANENEIRQYLLGTMTERLCEQIEDTLLITDEGLERIKLIEETLIDDYLTGDLSKTERKQFEKVFLCTAERQRKLDYLRSLRAAAQIEQESERETNILFLSRQMARAVRSHMVATRQWPKLAAAFLLVLGGSLAVRTLWYRPSLDKGLTALNQAYAGSRPLETRIAGFSYAPFHPSRGLNETETEARILRERAERILLDAVAEKPSAANQHALGKFYLAEKRFDQAIELFQAALKGLPQNPALENDLGAAFFELSKLESLKKQNDKGMQHLAEGFEHFSRALELQPDYSEALFNRALCKEKMLLPNQAAEDWNRYLQLDSKSEWADEARRRVGQIQKTGQRLKYDPEKWYSSFLSACETRTNDRAFELLSESYQSTGNVITERLIDEYLEAKENRDEAASKRCLQCLSYAGLLALQRTNEPYFDELARYYRQNSSQQRLLIRRARQHTQDAIKLSREGHKQEATERFAIAQQLFQQAGDEWEETFVNYLRGIALLRLDKFDECAAIFQPLSQLSNRYIWLRGQAFYALSDLHDKRGMLGEALQENQLALGIANQLQDTNFRLRSLNQAAIYWYLLGDWGQSLTYLSQAREIAAEKPMAAIEFWAIDTLSSFVCSDQQLLRAAIALQIEAAKTAEEMKRELQISRSYTHLGTIFGLQGDFTTAIQFAKRGYDIGARYSNPQDARVITDYSGLQLAHLQRRSGDYEAAVKSYSDVISRIQNEKQPVYQFDAYRGKALAEIALGKRAEAQQNLDSALQVFEQNRQAIWDENARNRFFDREYEIYDVAIGFAYTESPLKAFEYSERSRAKSLRELLGATRDKQLNDFSAGTLSAVQLALPADVRLLQYAVLPDQLIVWGISRKHFVSAKIPIQAAVLERQVTQLFDSVSRPSTPFEQNRPLAQALYRSLIEPLTDFIGDNTMLVIIPDKFLNYVPFSALLSPQTGKYLVEYHATISAPSTSVFLYCSENAARRPPLQSERLLVVGNPNFAPEAYPNLANLTEAEHEAREIAQLYPNHKLLLGGQANEPTVVEEMKNADVIHLALHGIKDSLSPLNSFLLLAITDEKAGQDGRLQAYEIKRLNPLRARLAIMSACHSGVESYYRGEGAIGLSRQFLATNVPTVLGSFWAVDSTAATKLMTSFHYHMIKRSLSPPHSLQMSQRSYLSQTEIQSRHPYYWAAFSLFGGNAPTDH